MKYSLLSWDSGVIPLGEMTSEVALYQNQFAATIADLLGLNFTAEHEVGKPLKFDR